MIDENKPGSDELQAHLEGEGLKPFKPEPEANDVCLSRFELSEHAVHVPNQTF